MQVLDIINLTEDEVWNLPEGKHIVNFSDGQLELSERQIILSHYYWRLFREFPGALVLKEHAVQGIYTSKNHQQLGAKIFWHVIENVTNGYDKLVWDASQVFYEIGNSIYNMTCVRLSEYVTTASLHDIVEILDDPKIAKAKSEYMDLTVSSDYDGTKIRPAISGVHEVIDDVLYKDTVSLPTNGIKKLCTADIVSKGQLLQLIGPRGYVKDIDGRVFPYPVDVGYAEGLSTLYDSSIESRSAARALFMNQAPLQDSEYFNREMQLLASSLHSCVGECCTGFTTLTYLVQAQDEQLLDGKYMMVDDVPVLINGSIDELVGKAVQLRTITGCGNRDVQTVCKTCLGWSHNVIPPGTNVGYHLATVLCAIISQLILSTKHYEGSAGAKELPLHGAGLSWFSRDMKDGSRLLLSNKVLKAKPTFRISKSMVMNLNNILSVDIDELPANKLTNCTEVMAFTKNGGSFDFPEYIKLELSGTGSHLSPEVLKYLKLNGWSSTDKYIEFTLENWPINAPVFITPHVGDNIYLYLKEVKAFMIPTKKSETSVVDFRTRGLVVSELVTLLRTRLKLNIIQAEVFIRAVMTKNAKGGDFSIPGPKDSFEFTSAREVMLNRSLTGLLAFQQQSQNLLSSEWFQDKDRPTHLLDELV